MIIYSCNEGDVGLSVQGSIGDLCADAVTLIHAVWVELKEQNPVAAEFFKETVRERIMDDDPDDSIFTTYYKEDMATRQEKPTWRKKRYS